MRFKEQKTLENSRSRNTHTQAGRKKIECTDHFKHKKCFELLTTNNVKLITDP
ncbi:hypothetical protein EXN66_Car004063 [Channa argus]|uniref:Uncharacterized protein n=1 Tax=Channa argus TaxID=215402 RepID=A0A6G1PDK6_CHAAH|nr:hypothetical protein EXN66_Car004063 [Channa argus]